ncbi:MAG: hypothetical protein K6E42_06530, partial [Synergistes sp.]|nr:hypothetical protein [Synergistes sp.]
FDPFPLRGPEDDGSCASSACDAFGENSLENGSQNLERLFCRILRLSYDDPDPACPEVLFMTALKRDRYGVYMTPVCSGFSPLYRADSELSTRFLGLAESSGSFDDIILDVPCGHPSFEVLASLCEFRFAVRRKDSMLPLNGYFERALNDAAEEAGAVFGIFEPGFDEWAGRLDIHGQLGSEVKRFAESFGLE